MLTVILYGLVRGGAYALAAIGLVLIFRTSRVVNFAHGAIATVVTFTFLSLDTREPIKIVFFTLRVDLPTPVALVAALALAAGLGLLIERTTMRPLQEKGQAAKLVATLGWLLVLQFGTDLVFGRTTKFVQPIFGRPDQGIDVLGVRLAYFQLALVVITVGLTYALYVWLTRTRFGASIRAVSQDRGSAQMLGVDADRVTAVSWAVGGLLAGLAGILVGPSVSVESNDFTTLLFKAFAAALVVGFTSFIGAAIAGFLLGAVEDVAGYLIPVSFARELVTFALLLAILLLRSSAAWPLFVERGRGALRALRGAPAAPPTAATPGAAA